MKQLIHQSGPQAGRSPQHEIRDNNTAPALIWLLVSATGGALAAVVVAGIVAGRVGLPISGALLLAAALLGTMPQLAALARGRWRVRPAKLAAALVALLVVGGVGVGLAWPALLPLGMSVDAVHHYQLVRWIAEHGALPLLDGTTRGLLGEMVAYPPGLALVVVAVATLTGQPPIGVLYPTVAAIGGLNAALVVLLTSAGGELSVKHAALRKSYRWPLLYVLALLIGPLLLLAHRAYTLEAYTDQSYYAMVLGVLLLLLAAGQLIVAPRLTPGGAAQLGLTLAALVGVYPLWVAIAAAFAALVIGFTVHPPARVGRQAGSIRRLFGAQASAFFIRGLSPMLPSTFPGGPFGFQAAISRTWSVPEAICDPPSATRNHAGDDCSVAVAQRAWRHKLLLGVLALGPALGLALLDLPERLRIGRLVLAHEGVVTLPTNENLVPISLALLAVLLLGGSGVWRAARERRGGIAAWLRAWPAGDIWAGHGRLIGLAGLALAALLALFGAAQLGLAASYHAYKLLFALTPLAAAIVGAAALRMIEAARAWRAAWARWLVLAAVVGLLAVTRSFPAIPRPAVAALTPDLVAAAGWLAEHRPRDAKRAIAVGAPAGTSAYWLRIGLLSQRRDTISPTQPGFDIPAPSPESWLIDDTLPKFVVAPVFNQLPPGAEVVARFGDAAVLRRAPQFDMAALDPLLIRYRTVWEDQRLKTQIELLQRLPGRAPLLELRLSNAGGPVATFPLQPDPGRTRMQFLGGELLPATLGGSGYINRDAFPTFAPPTVAPTGALTLTLRLTVAGNPLDERTLATFTRTDAQQIEQLTASAGELVYLRRLEATPAPASGGARLTDELVLDGWTGPNHADRRDVLAVGLRWQATRPIDRALLTEIQLIDSGGRVVAGTIASPQQGFYPTWRWRPGERVADEQRIVLPADLVPGVYRLRVSLRDFGAGRDMAGSAAVQLGELVIE